MIKMIKMIAARKLVVTTALLAQRFHFMMFAPAGCRSKPVSGPAGRPGKDGPQAWLYCSTKLLTQTA
jgi:hypothetical protein